MQLKLEVTVSASNTSSLERLVELLRPLAELGQMDICFDRAEIVDEFGNKLYNLLPHTQAEWATEVEKFQKMVPTS